MTFKLRNKDQVLGALYALLFKYEEDVRRIDPDRELMFSVEETPVCFFITPQYVKGYRLSNWPEGVNAEPQWSNEKPFVLNRYANDLMPSQLSEFVDELMDRVTRTQIQEI